MRCLFASLSFTLAVVSTSSSIADGGFVHPGVLHSREDLARMKAAVAAKQEPIYSGFRMLEQSKYSKSNYRLRGPFPEWGRAPNIRTGEAQSDAQAAYENALMWAITEDRAHARKSMQIIDAWRGRLKKVTGIDGVLAAGLQGIKFVAAAEILRYTDSGWPEANAKDCERWFMEAWYPTIEHYAYFANGNWETAALQTNMAIAVYCNDRELFEKQVLYAVSGAGNGSIPHMVINAHGQCQETTRAQHYAQLGIGLLAGAAETAWHQGVDLYGWNDNRLLQGYEYTARYGFGEDVPFQNYLDRTGKYGFGGRHWKHTEISKISRGRYWQIYERIFQHYTKRAGVSAPYSGRVVDLKRPESSSRDHVGLGTLTHWRRPASRDRALGVPGAPAGLEATFSGQGNLLTWVRSVDPVSCTVATSYSIERSSQPGGPYRMIADGLRSERFHDTDSTVGTIYYYRLHASNEIGTSSPSAELAACTSLPTPWASADIGTDNPKNESKYDGKTFTLEGEGKDIGGREDSFHFAYVKMVGQGTVTARIVRPMSSQWTKPGVMMRESLEPDSRHASVLLLPTSWSGALVSRTEKGGDTSTSKPRALGEKHVIKKNRLSTPYWVRLIRFRNTFTGYMSADGFHWRQLGSIEIPMSHKYYIGLPACSQLNGVTTTVTYDSVFTPVWRMETENRRILARPEPRWHKEPWLKRHEAMNARAREGNVDLLMIGDSITHWWDKAGKRVWDQYYAPRNGLNLAISGDRTEHVLWRLENGNLEGISPKLAVLMIGTNNHMSSPPEVTARDIRLIVETLRTRVPETKILVLAIFPRGGDDRDGARQINMRVNELIADVADGQMVHFANINDTFLNGRRLKHDLIPDGSHPGEKGYAAWAEALEPYVVRLMGEK
ncbi:MAG: GDSL-type esterase/lipase family protein [Planctomycetota bacterium]